MTAVEIAGGLHLKSGVTELADGVILVNPNWVDASVFAAKTVIRCDPDEPRSANASPSRLDDPLPTRLPQDRRPVAGARLRAGDHRYVGVSQSGRCAHLLQRCLRSALKRFCVARPEALRRAWALPRPSKTRGVLPSLIPKFRHS